ncbi:MAG: hypothetical protein M3O86_05630 [Actinomycetota bacterium]|nr:hypothetical protein [Actinomycetota bacterium]
MTAVGERRSTAVRPATRTLPWAGVATALLAWVASRALVVAAIAVGNHWRGQGQTVMDALHLWDGNWYLSAAAGYDYRIVPAGQPTGQVNIAFFPAYPLAIRFTEAVTGWSPLVSAVAVAWLFGAVAVVLIWLLVRRISGEEVAGRAATLFCFFPGSVILSFVYSEPLMLTFAAGCLLALLSRRWAAAGVLAALAGFARPNGLVLALCCAWAAGVAIVSRREWRALIAPALAPLGVLLWFAWLGGRTGDPAIWMRVEREGWGEGVDFGRRTIGSVLAVAKDLPTPSLWLAVPVAGLLFAAVALVLLWRWRPPAVVVVYTLGILALAFVSQTLGARPRFVMTAFPLIAAVAWAVRGTAYPFVLAGFAVLSAGLAMVYAVPLLSVP